MPLYDFTKKRSSNCLILPDKPILNETKQRLLKKRQSVQHLVKHVDNRKSSRLETHDERNEYTEKTIDLDLSSKRLSHQYLPSTGMQSPTGSKFRSTNHERFEFVTTPKFCKTFGDGEFKNASGKLTPKYDAQTPSIL